MKKILEIIIGVFILLVIIGIFSGDKKTQTTVMPTPTPTIEIKPTTTPTPTVTEIKTDDETINAIYRSAFVSSCSESGSTSINKCRCMFNYLLDNYGIEKMVQVANSGTASTNRISIEAAISCVNVK